MVRPGDNDLVPPGTPALTRVLVCVQHGAGGAGKGKDRGAEHIVTLGKGSFFGEGSLVYHRRVATVR